MRAALYLAITGLVAAGCGGAGKGDVDEPGPPREKIVAEHDPSLDEEPDTQEEDDDNEEFEVEGLTGHLDPYDIEQGMAPHNQALAACYHDNVRKMRFVDGKVEMKYKVGRDGAVKSVYLSESDLGAWNIESCLLAIARSMKFKKPRGKGDADFSIPLDFTSGRTRALWLSDDQSQAEVEDYIDMLDECEGSPSDVWITLYVGPRGKVKSVGFASKNGTSFTDEWAECAQTMIMDWQLTDPRGKISKLAFQYNAK